ncbi:MAG: AMP-binding protein [Paracoccaceae bacterium]|nr:AMP-binding protein [Paracoccaceae bacterium]MDG2260022.1 AMP-binding protein [Paracoccaceae bacterium]
MIKLNDQFTWSSNTKIDLVDISGGKSLSTGIHPSNSKHRRSLEMLDEIRTLVQGGSSFRMQPDGPTEIKPISDAREGILECMTSGSSGAPKIIRRSHLSWIASFEINTELFNLSPEDTYAVLGSLEHSISLYGTLEAAHIGASLCLLAALRSDKQLKLLHQNRVSVLYATPTQLENLAAIASPDLQLKDVRCILIGGGAFSATLAEKCRDLFPFADLNPFYGASETSFITIANADSPQGSVGSAYPNVEISIRSESGQITNGTGEIWVKSPYLYAGYAEPVVSDTKQLNGFVTVGEYGYLDQAANLFVRGRKGRMVTVSDQNVYPDEIEQFLSVHYKAGPLAVVPVPDDKRGHRLAVIATDDARKASLEVALELCRKTYGAHSTPKYMYFAKDLPQLASGKLDYAKIDAWIKERL